MGISTTARRAPLRVTTGAFILNSGLTKLSADDETSKQLQSMASALTPRVQQVTPQAFARTVAAGEITLGTALLLPLVPTAAAGLGLTAFAASLLTMWWRTPGMHEPDSVRPTPGGVTIAKDVWMLGSGVSLVADSLTTPAHDKHVELSATVHEKVAAKRRGLRRARQRAALSERAHDVGERVVELRDEYQPIAEKKLKKARKQVKKKSKRLASAARDAAQDAGDRIQAVRA